MVFVKYSIPLPNNGERYDFSAEELVQLLDSVYEKGYADGKQAAIEPITTTASTEE